MAFVLILNFLHLLLDMLPNHWCFGNMLVVLHVSARAALRYVICFETAWLWLNGLSLSVFYAGDTVGSVAWKNAICEPFWLALYLIQF